MNVWFSVHKLKRLNGCCFSGGVSAKGGLSSAADEGEAADEGQGADKGGAAGKDLLRVHCPSGENSFQADVFGLPVWHRRAESAHGGGKTV